MRRQLRRGALNQRGTASGSARRGPRLTIVLLLAFALSGVAANIGPLPAAAANAIQLENQNPGDPTWDDFASVANQDAISGYGSKISVNHGDSIDFYVTTTAASLTIDIFRTGWYGGVGARKMASLGTFSGVHQASCTTSAVTGMVSCTNWTKTTTLAIPSTWTTGAYLAKLTASSGNKSYIFFVVRNDGGHEAIALQTSVTTYQAYNAYGGISLYTNNTNGSVYPYAHATKVSFDRPFDPNDSNGAGHFLYADYPFIRWAESQGYDLTYITDVDTHTNVNPLTNHQAFLSVGHDEYWSMGMRTNVQNAINSGVNVGFFGANDMYWQIRFEPNANGVANRVQVGYKDTAIFNTAPGPDPMFGVNNSLVTTNWRDTPVNMPENAVIGVMYDGQVTNNNYAYVVQNASNWVYAGTGFSNGTSIPGIVGYEFDKVWNNGATPAGLTTLSNSPVCCSDTQWDTGGSSTSQATIYTAASGARVFAAGSIDWSWGLDNYASGNTANAGIQKMTANILNNFISGSPPTAPAVTLSPTSLTFASQTVGTTSAAQSVTLTNSGNAALTISSIGLTGTSPGDFAQTNTCPIGPSTLAAGASCSISVTFSPTAAGTRAASVSIADNAAGSPQTVGLTGTGATAASPAVTLAPTSLTFASQTVGTTSTAQSVTLTNSGTAALTISAIGLTGTNPGDFSQTNTCPISPSTLAAGVNCTFSVTFRPTATGSRSASVSVTDDAAGSPQAVGLSGTGAAATSPAVTLAPTSLTFTSQQVGTTSSAQAVTLTNSGSAALTISSIGLGGTNPGDFAQTNTCPIGPSTLAAGANCTISVTFSPTASGSRSASVSIADDAAGSPQSITLSGTGTSTTPAGIAAMPVVSRGVPAYASNNSYPPSWANDNDYSTVWDSAVTPSTSNPAWLAYDLSGVAAANRANVVLVWYNDDTGDYIQAGGYYGLPSDYTIQANAAPGGTAAPSSGWVTLVTVTGNTYTNREHILNLAGYNWVRMSVTAVKGQSGANDAVFQMDVHDISQGNQDNWLFLGDSITMEGFNHHNIDGSAWAGGNYQQLINAAQPPYFPLAIDGGAGATTMQWGYDNRVALLQNFTGQYVAISFGTNDANVSGALDATTVNSWYTNLLGLVDYVTSLGKTPVVGKIPWGSASGGWLATNAQTLNSKIDQLYTDRPQVIHGPDLYTFFSNHQNLINSDGLHPTYDHSVTSGTYQGFVGYEWLQREWRDAMLANVYNASAPSAPAVTLSPTSLTFSGQTVGTTSAAQSVTLTNSGNAALTISSVGIGGTNPGDFAQTNTCPIGPSTLAAGASCTISVTFGPTAGGSRSAGVSIADDAAGSPQSVALAGTGQAPGVGLSPASLTFASQPTGTTSAAQSVTLTNTGSADLTISSIGLSGANPGDFSQTNTCPISPSTLATGASCSISVTFSPTAAGTRTASVSIADDAAGSPQTVGLTGTGTTPAPVVSLAPTSLTFSSQLVGTTSAAQAVTLTNTGNAALTISSVGIGGTNASDFAQTNTCPLSPSTLAAGANCTISVTFGPTAGGSRSASVSIADDAAGSPQSVALAGTGTTPTPAASPSPTSLAFGSQPVGTMSAAAQTVTLTNTGTADLTISGATLTGTNPGDFVTSGDTCTGATLSPNAACTVNVSFAPAATGSRTASLAFADNAADSPQSVGLSGTGTAPGASLSPTTLTFSSQLVGTTSAAQAVTLTNTGNAALTISSVGIGGTNASDFAQTNTCPISPSTLAAGAKCTISVTFSPAAAGTRTATLSVTDNAAGSPQTAALSGTGTTTSNVLFSDGFESGSLPGAWTSKSVSSGNTLALDTTLFHGGTASLKAVKVRGKGGNAKVSKSITGQTTLDARGYYYLSNPVNWGAVQLMSFYAQGNFVGWVSYYVDPSSPTLTVLNGATGVSYNCTLPSLNAWHSIELQYVLATTATGSFTLWVDGVQACAKSGIKTMPYSGLKINQVVVGVDSADTTAGLTVHVDDVVISKSYIGP